MPEFFICNRSQVRRRVKQLGITHLLTLLDPGRSMFKPTLIAPANWLWLKFEDQESPQDLHAPTLEHAERILAWGKNLPKDARVLVHCQAGVSRSTASALALWVQTHNTLTGARDWIDHIRPQACPNMLLAEFFDKLLGMQGEFQAMCDSIGHENIKRFFV